MRRKEVLDSGMELNPVFKERNAWKKSQNKNGIKEVVTSGQGPKQLGLKKNLCPDIGVHIFNTSIQKRSRCLCSKTARCTK